LGISHQAQAQTYSVIHYFTGDGYLPWELTIDQVIVRHMNTLHNNFDLDENTNPTIPGIG